MRITLDQLHMYCTQCGTCLLWNLGVNSTGYPQANIEGKPGQMVRRHIFLNLLGRTLKKGERVASRCDRKLCVEPSCLYAESHGKTLSRAYRAGKRMGALEYARRLDASRGTGMAKLTWEQVHAIRCEPDTRTHTSIAEEYGMSHKSISEIRRGITWKTSASASSVFAWRPN